MRQCCTKTTIKQTRDNSPNYNTIFCLTPPSLEETITSLSLNVSKGSAGMIMKQLFQKAELTGICEKTLKYIGKGKTVKERLQAVKKLTVGKIFKAKSCCVEKTCYRIALEKHKAKLDDANTDKKRPGKVEEAAPQCTANPIKGIDH